MHKPRFLIVRVALMAIALAIVAVLVGRGADNTAEATSFDPSFKVTVVDPTPSSKDNPVHSDLKTVFALDAPDSFPQDNPPTFNFFPPEWGVAQAGDAPLGALASEFETLNAISFFRPCSLNIGLPFEMLVSTTDISTKTSDFDLPGAPGGTGFSGQFADDPDAPGLQAGVTHFPDFLVDLFDLDTIGPPRARLFGWLQVVFSPVSLNFLTFDPGQLPGFPASRGYPTAVVLLNPTQPDVVQFNITPDVCTPLSVVNTAFGETKDNPDTAADESGFTIFTNPDEDAAYTFGLHTESQPDADDDGIENLLDSCPFDTNIDPNPHTAQFDADGDGIDSTCDPEPNNPSPPNALFNNDEDQDGYGNPGDNCPLDPNGIEILGFTFGSPPFVIVPDLGGTIGPNEQLDSDDDGIGDVCDPNPSTTDGHVHVIDFSQDAVLGEHGVELKAFEGPEAVSVDGTPATYEVTVKNEAELVSQDILVGMWIRAASGCFDVVGGTRFARAEKVAEAVPPKGTATVSFTVQYNEDKFNFCRGSIVDRWIDQDGSVVADACHPGDPDADVFGGTRRDPDCGGEDPHGVLDTKPSDDAPVSFDIDVTP